MSGSAGLSVRRRLAHIAYPRRISLFDKLNQNVDFFSVVPRLLEGAKHVDNSVGLYTHLNDDVLKKCPIDYLEFGVFEGWSIKQWARLNQNPESRFVGFDTFTGLPEDWTTAKKAGAFDVGGKIPEASDPRVRFVAGLFQRTLVGFLRSFDVKNQLVVHIDCDLYSATLFCLATLDRHMPPGTIVVFDEFFDVLHEFAAFRDYCSAFMRDAKGLAYTDGYIQVALKLG